MVHYLPDYSPSLAPDLSYNPSYKPQIFIKGIKSNLLGFGSQGKMISVSHCGNFIFLKKSVNTIIRVDLKLKLNSKSLDQEKSSCKVEVKCDDILIVDFSALGSGGDLIVLGDKCRVKLFSFNKTEDGVKPLLLD